MAVEDRRKAKGLRQKDTDFWVRSEEFAVGSSQLAVKNLVYGSQSEFMPLTGVPKRMLCLKGCLSRQIAVLINL